MKALVRVAVVAEMKVDINDMENAKNEMDDAISSLLQVGEHQTLEIRLASRKDLEDMAAAGALLPDPGIYVVKKKTKHKKE
jgi:hypothetical protein